MSNLLESLFEYNFMVYLSIVIPVFLAITMLFVRKKTVLKPMSVKRLLLPTLFMSTGFIMFIFPFFQIALKLAFEVVFIGILFSFLLTFMSRFQVRNNEVYLIPSKYLFVFLLLLFFIRIITKLIIGNVINIGETAGTFFILAFSTLFTWRIAMVIKYLIIKHKK